MAKRDYKKGAIPYEFIGLPRAILQSDEYMRLPFAAKALMNDLAAQYTGKNNGRLCPSFAAMQKSGWTAPNTLSAAKKALLQCSFVVLTRKGHPPKTAEWIGFTWWHLNYEPTMDIAPKGFPYLNFMSVKNAAIDPNQGRERPIRQLHPDIQKLYRSNTNEQPRYTETVSIDEG